MNEVLEGEETRGIDQPISESPLPPDVVAALRAPLDPARVRTRQGRGSTQFSYLAGHDAKRRANELFGFGNWGYTVERLEETASVGIEGREGKSGWHISYMAIVRFDVRGCLPFSDVGYGDGVEYGPAALAQARELATKEAVTDAMKRAATGWGDQFGLILYAKADEKQRIQRDDNTGAATARGGNGRANSEAATDAAVAEYLAEVKAAGFDTDVAMKALLKASGGPPVLALTLERNRRELKAAIEKAKAPA